MVNDILINTETDLNRWTAIHRLFMTHKTPMPIFFVHHLFTIYWRYVHTVSPEGRIIKYFLSIFLFSSHQSVFFKGKRRSYILVFTRTTTHKTYKLYMLVTVIQHLMAIIKSIFLLFFFFSPVWDLVLTIRTTTEIFQTKEQFKAPYFTLIPTSYLFLLSIFWAVRSCMLKGNQRLHTLVHTDKIKHHSKKKSKLRIWNLLF